MKRLTNPPQAQRHLDGIKSSWSVDSRFLLQISSKVRKLEEYPLGCSKKYMNQLAIWLKLLGERECYFNIKIKKKT